MNTKIKRIVSLILAMAMAFCLCTENFTVSADYTCSNYDECTANGDIYVITKDNCPIRESPSNDGNIVARGHINELISVKRVFWTIKATRWAEINTSDGHPLYIYIENCEPHDTHSWIPLAANNKGTIVFCAVCGISLASTNNASASCDLTCVADHAIKGSFSKADNSFISVVAEILVGDIPLVGTIADVRDIIGSILTGAPASEVILNCAALLPLVGAFKYSDEIATIGKHSDDIIPAAGKMSRIPWGKWSDYEKVVVNGREYAKIGDFKYTEHAVSEFLTPSISTNYLPNKNFTGLNGFKNLIEHSRGVPPTYVNYILTEGVKNGTTKVVANTNGEGLKYINGSLEIIVQNGDQVVSIITK